MKLFLVSFIANDGTKHREFMDANTVSELLNRLSNRSLVPVRVKELPTILRLVISLFSKKVTKLDMAELLSHLHIIVRSGLPLYQGLKDLAAENSNSTIKNMLLTIQDQISSGVRLSTSCEAYERYFGKTIINLIRIGEDTGSLETTLEKASQFLRRSFELKRKVVSALIYPAIVLTVVIGAVLVWFTFVLPLLANLFNQMDIALPPLTQFLINVSKVVESYGLGFLLFLVVTLMGSTVLYQRFDPFAKQMDYLLMRLPKVGSVIKFYNNAFITEYLELSLSSGIPLYNALETVSQNTHNRHYKLSLQMVRESLLKGELLSTSLQNTHLFTPFTVRMLHIGEKSGNIEDQLQTVSTYYHMKVDTFTQNISKIIEPAIIIFIGGFFALIMVALMGPIFDIVVKVI